MTSASVVALQGVGFRLVAADPGGRLKGDAADDGRLQSELQQRPQLALVHTLDHRADQRRGQLVLGHAGQRGPFFRQKIGAAEGDVAGRVEPVKLQVQLQPRLPPGELGGQGGVAGQLPAVGVDHDVLDRQLAALVDDLQQLRMQRAVRRR